MSINKVNNDAVARPSDGESVTAQPVGQSAPLRHMGSQGQSSQSGQLGQSSQSSQSGQLGRTAQTGLAIWLTGLSGAGKSTLAARLAAVLAARGRRPEVLDGDVVRTHLSKGLGFSKEDRDTNIRRIAFVSHLVVRQGGVVIVAAISPYRETRDEARALLSAAGGFVEVFVDCPLEELVRRDVKGLYARALRGELPQFTGISDPYEPPLAPEVHLHTDRETIDESVAKIVAYLEAQGFLAPGASGASVASVASVAPAPHAPPSLDGRAAGSEAGREGAPAVSGAPSLDGRAGSPSLDGRAVVLEGRAVAAGRPRLWAHLGQPHGGRLVRCQAAPEVVADWEARLARGELPRIEVASRERCDLELLGNGGFSPLDGFMGERDYRAVIESLRLASGLVWPIPIVLGVSEAQAAALREGQPVALVDGTPEGQRGGAGELLAVLEVRERVRLTEADVRREVRAVYRTEDEAHPGVRAVYARHARGPVLLGGPVTVLRRPARAAVFAPYRLEPADTRAAFAARGWRTIVGFQTRNPVHRAHEYLLKTALESVDGLLLHPLIGATKEDDIPAEVRLRCYQVLLAGYFPAERVVFGVLPAAMRYAGPREAIFHALMRKNYGCTHFIVGRDHAGVGSYYGPYDAQRIFEQFSEEELGIRPLFFEHAFYCTACGGMASAKTCPHEPSRHVTLSGTKVRALLAEGVAPPPEFSRPEVAQVLIEAARAAAAV